MKNLYKNLHNYIFSQYEYLRWLSYDLGIEETKEKIDKEIDKLNTEPFYGFAVMLDGLIIQYSIAETKKEAMNKKKASWWKENPKAKVVELELVEKKS